MAPKFVEKFQIWFDFHFSFKNYKIWIFCFRVEKSPKFEFSRQKLCQRFRSDRFSIRFEFLRQNSDFLFVYFSGWQIRMRIIYLFEKFNFVVFTPKKVFRFRKLVTEVLLCEASLDRIKCLCLTSSQKPLNCFWVL